VREVLALRTGDIVRLENTPQDPLEVKVGDRAVFYGQPMVQRGNLAMQIADVI